MIVPSEREALIRLKSIYQEYLLNIENRIREIDRQEEKK